MWWHEHVKTVCGLKNSLFAATVQSDSDKFRFLRQLRLQLLTSLLQGPWINFPQGNWSRWYFINFILPRFPKKDATTVNIQTCFFSLTVKGRGLICQQKPFFSSLVIFGTCKVKLRGEWDIRLFFVFVHSARHDAPIDGQRGQKDGVRGHSVQQRGDFTPTSTAAAVAARFASRCSLQYCFRRVGAGGLHSFDRWENF